MNTILNWAGRLGNNIQQVGNAILFSEYTNSTFEQNLEHEIINKFFAKFGEIDSNVNCDFFCYTPIQNCFDNTFEGQPYCGVCDLGLDYVYKNMRRVLKTYVLPNLKLIEKNKINDSLVIHIRSGDIFCQDMYWGRNYIQNPLSFYLKIIKNFDKILIVTEPDNCNPIVEELCKKNNVTVQSTSILNDFSTLMSAENLVLSGVGTFGAAAAILSNNLKNLYVSDLFLDEHLNYKMIENSDINIIAYRLNNFMDKCSWRNTQEQREYLINYKMEN